MGRGRLIQTSLHPVADPLVGGSGRTERFAVRVCAVCGSVVIPWDDDS